MAFMQSSRRVTAAYYLATGLVMASFITVAHGSDGQQLAESGVQVISKPVTAMVTTPKSGILAWLESLFPSGISFTGPTAALQNQPEILATANCFDSGAGMSCNGFRSLEEYLAAAHVSENLHIPIAELRQKIKSGRTLHQAIHELRPGVNSQLEAMRAEQQARRMLKDLTS
jgi:hypothetical protein